MALAGRLFRPASDSANQQKATCEDFLYVFKVAQLSCVFLDQVVLIVSLKVSLRMQNFRLALALESVGLRFRRIRNMTDTHLC
ncbi:MAG: hypothetical protein ACYC0I_02715, partial [Acidimicrobiales bacterium]